MDKSLFKDLVSFYINNKIYTFNNPKGVYNYTPSFAVQRFKFHFDKVDYLLENYAHLFNDKTILDFGSGTGEHSYIFSNFAKKVYTYDANPFHQNIHSKLFSTNKLIEVLHSESACFPITYDTVFCCCMIENVPNHVEWLFSFTDKLKFNHFILIRDLKDYTNSDKNQTGQHRDFRIDSNKTYCHNVTEEDIQNATKHLTLLHSFVIETPHHDHFKQAYIFKK